MFEIMEYDLSTNIIAKLHIKLIPQVLKQVINTRYIISFKLNVLTLTNLYLI